MCTVIALSRVHPRYPLILAANRDERYARPSSGAARIEQPRAVVAGLDREHGGTWFGANAHGVVVAVTDQAPPAADGRGEREPAASVRSRGLLVLDALIASSPASVTAMLAAIDPSRYNPFSLLYGNRDGITIGHHTPQGMRQETLPAGLHVLVSHLDAAHSVGRVGRARAALAIDGLTMLDAPGLVDTFRHVLSQHAEPGGLQDGLCRHGPTNGTVSSFVMLLTDDVVDSKLYCAAGAPCQATYQDVGWLFAGLAPTATSGPTV